MGAKSESSWAVIMKCTRMYAIRDLMMNASARSVTVPEEGVLAK